MKHLLEFILEAKNWNTIMNATFSERGNAEIKQIIQNDGIKHVLSVLGKHGVSFRSVSFNNNPISWQQKWGRNGAKASTEYARGAFGGNPDDFVKNITYLFKNILRLNDDDFEFLDINPNNGKVEPKVHRFKSSNSKMSLEINVHFNGYNDHFYICNTQLGRTGQEILLRSSVLLPKNIIEPGKEYKNKTELLKCLSTGLDNSLKDTYNKESYKQLLMNISSGILNYKDNKNQLKLDELNTFTDIKSYVYELKLSAEDINTFKSLDITSINNIATHYGEILAGLSLINTLDKFNSLAWPNVGEQVNDLYIDSIGFSVKRKDAEYGHKLELSSIASKIKKAVEDIDSTGDDLYIVTIQSIADNSNIQLTSKEILQFKKDIEIFDNFDETGKRTRNKERMIWDAVFTIFENDEIFKEIISTLDILSPEYGTCKHVLYKLDTMSDENRNNFLHKVRKFSGSNRVSADTEPYQPFKWETEDKFPYKKSDDLIKTANYSKIMKALQLALVKELNNRYVKDNETSDLFSILVSNALQSKQIYIDIDVRVKDDNIIISVKLENMKTARYKFYSAGSTWNNWDKHGSVGFGIKK